MIINIFLQLGLPLLLSAIIVVFLIIKRRAFSLKRIILSLLLLIISGGMIFLGVKTPVNQEEKVFSVSQKKMMEFANALVLDNAYDEAREIIDQYSDIYGYDDECRLVNARIALLESDNDRAYHLYTYLSENSKLIPADSEELTLASNQVSYGINDIVTLNQEVRNEEESDEDSEIDDVFYKSLFENNTNTRSAIRKGIESDHSISQDILDCSKAVAKVSGAFLEVSEGEDEDAKASGKYKRAFSEIEGKSKDLLAIEAVDKARIKAYVLSGDYDEITKNLDKDSTYHELMVSAELYMSGLVKNKDFSKKFQNISKSDIKNVEKRLDKVYKNVQDELSVQEKKSLKARVKSIDNQLEDPELATIKECLLEKNDEEVGIDKTKVDLEVAKIENYFGNDASTKTYLSSAINTSQVNDDDSYVDAMSHVISVINSSEENSDSIKNVSEYIGNALDHSLTIDVEDIVSPNYSLNSNSENKGSKKSSNFIQTATDDISEKVSSIVIGNINVKNKEVLDTTVQIDSDYINDVKKLSSALKVYDCGEEITDFDIKKIDYTGINIILACDVSGSMSGSINDLKNAVTTFIEDKNKDENLSIVTFDSSIIGSCPFGSSDEELKSFTNSMTDMGGTDIYSAAIDCLNRFSSSKSECNMLILMTDGQDNYPRSNSEIRNEIGKLASQKNAVIFTMGLGSDVDVSYLSTIANSGNGDYMHAYNDASLSSCYDILHSRLYSQYSLTYKLKDTTTEIRTIKVSLPAENVYDTKTYSLNNEEIIDMEYEEIEGLSILGVYPNALYKSQNYQKTNVRLKGEGFSGSSKISVKFLGTAVYDVQTTFVDSETYSIVLPSNITVGTYDVEIILDGNKRKEIKSGFSIIGSGSEKYTIFGPYAFTSAEKIVNDKNDITLRGMVTLNGWLHFNGDINIKGDLKKDSFITITDNSGSYVEYNNQNAKGYAGRLARSGVPLSLPSFGSFVLHNDKEHLDNLNSYAVSEINVKSFILYKLMDIGGGTTIKLFPDKMKIKFEVGHPRFPLLDKIFKNLNQNDDDKENNKEDNDKKKSKDNSLFKIDTTDSMIVNSEMVDFNITGQIDFENAFNNFIFVGTDVGIGSFEFSFNTAEDEYSVGASLNFNIFNLELLDKKIDGKIVKEKDRDKGSLSVKCKFKNGEVESIKATLKPNKTIQITTTPIPSEFESFSFEASNLFEASRDCDILKAKFTGTMSIVSLNIFDEFPKLAKHLDRDCYKKCYSGITCLAGDECGLSVFKVPDAKISLTFSPFSIEASANLQLFEEIKIASAKVNIGNFKYTNKILGYEDVNTAGFMASLTQGIDWKNSDESLSLVSTGTGEFDAHQRFIGLSLNGTFKANINWWFIDYEKEKTGDVILGFVDDNNRVPEFAFAYKYINGNKIDGAYYYINIDGHAGPRDILN